MLTYQQKKLKKIYLEIHQNTNQLWNQWVKAKVKNQKTLKGKDKIKIDLNQEKQG